MKTATEKYHAVLEGKLSEAEFIRQMRQAYPQYITQWNGYNDSVSILKQKQLIFEKKEVKKDIDVLADQFPLNVIERGIDAELEAKGIDSTGNVSKEDYMKARVKVIANLQKDQNHYINLLAGESSKVDKHDQMVEPKKGNEVDVHNGLKKADLKEEVNESNQEESIADFIIQHYTNPNTGKSLIDDQIIGDFFRTHPESKDQEPQDALDNFEEYLSVNYEMPGDYMQEKVAKSADDVIDPADYGSIGKGYLKGFNKPHSLSDDELETLGRKIVDSLYKGDFDAAKAKHVNEDEEEDARNDADYEAGWHDDPRRDEAMSDAEMDAIKDYGQKPAVQKTYQLGDMFSSDFDYDGMLKAGLKVRLNTPVDKMQALFDSFEDVNYHSEGSHLSFAIDAAKEGDKAGVLDNLKKFRAAIKKTLGSFNEGVSKVRKQLNERVGSLQEFISLIQDRAEENGTTEADEAEEVMYALGEHYNFGVDILHGPKESIKEGRRRKSQGGKVVTENDYETGGYVESMGPLFDKGVNLLIKAWEEWKMGPMTEPGMIEFAKKDVLEYLETQFMVENLEEAKLNEEGVEDANYPVMEAFKRYGIDMSKDVIVAEMDGGTPQFGGGKLGIEAAEPATVVAKRLEKHRLAAIAEYKSGNPDGDFPVMYEDGFYGDYTPKGTAHKLTYSEFDGTMWDIFQATSGVSEKKGKDHDGDGDVDKDDYMAAKNKAIKKAMGKDDAVKENIKAIIFKVLEEGVINEAATNALAEFSETYGGYEGMKQSIIALQDIVTDIESYYDKTRSKIQKVYDTLGDIRNEEGLKVGGFLAPAIEQAFNKDLRPAVKGGFTKGLEQPKVRVLTQKDIDAHNSGERPLGEEEKQTVFSAPTINGAL
jgi:hypothetical protein